MDWKEFVSDKKGYTYGSPRARAITNHREWDKILKEIKRKSLNRPKESKK